MTNNPRVEEMWLKISFWGAGVGVGVAIMALPQTGYLTEGHAWPVFWAGIAATLVCLAGVALSTPWAARLALSQGHWLPMWRLDSISLKTPPFRRLIPMKRAAQIAYEKTRDNIVASAAEHAARDLKDGYDGILNYYAWALVGRGDSMDLWGRRPPSTRLEPIDGAQECPQCSFVGGAGALRRHDDSEPRWTDLMVAKHQLKGRIKYIAGW